MTIQELKFEVQIDEKQPHVVEEAVSFETGAKRSQCADTTLWVYNHHGDEFGPAYPGALTAFYEDLILGRPLPLKFVTHKVRDVDALVAIALFLHRELAVHPSAPAFVANIDLVHRYGLTVLGHLSDDLVRFIRLLRAYAVTPGLTTRELGSRLADTTRWIREYITDGLTPDLGATLPAATVLDKGTNGFVVAQSTGSLIEAWVDLYRQGFLRGIVVKPDAEGRRHVLASKKSAYVRFDLERAASNLNEMERAMGELGGWRCEGLWLLGPEDGTPILLTHMMEVFLRV